VYVCVTEKTRERERERARTRAHTRERGKWRERERGGERERVCVCVCDERASERKRQKPFQSKFMRRCSHTYPLHMKKEIYIHD